MSIIGLRLAVSKGPNRVGSPSPHLKTETGPVSEALSFSFFQFLTMSKVDKPGDYEVPTCFAVKQGSVAKQLLGYQL
jgi:hypothetical protein